MENLVRNRRNNLEVSPSLISELGVPVVVILIILFTFLVIWCVVMNFSVILALLRGVSGYTRRKLRMQKDEKIHQESETGVFTNWTELYFANMDLVDICSGLLIFPPMATVSILGYFPFGKYVCNFWIFLDYFLVLWSAFGYGLLAFNYLWMIRWPESYLKSTLSTHIKIMSIGFICVFPIWIPPFIHDREVSLETNQSWIHCGYIISYSQSWSIYLGIFGLYIPLIIALTCSLWTIILAFQVQVDKNQISPDHSSIMSIDHGSNDIKPGRTFNSNWSHEIDQLAFIGWNEDMDKWKIIKTPSFNHLLEFSKYQNLKCKRACRKHIPALMAMFVLFIYSRLPFYIYYGSASFSNTNWSSDLSNWVFWVIHSNSPISPIVHMSFDREVRARVFKIIGIDKWFSRKKPITQDNLSNADSISNSDSQTVT